MFDFNNIFNQVKDSQLKWIDVKTNGSEIPDAVNYVSTLGFPSYSRVKDLEDFASVSMIVKEKDGYFPEEITAVLYDDGNGFKMDLYDIDELMNPDELEDYVILESKELDEAKKEAEVVIKDFLELFLIHVKCVLERYA